MKSRCKLSASEIVELYETIDRKLDDVGVQSQPDVVVKLLSLVSDPNAGLGDFAKVIKSDPAVAGRVLKLSNSALFAQRAQVTSLERACLVLGIERLKSISLGFHLSKAAAGGADISRRVWGQSVFRACLAAELARKAAPASVPEAFVVGLMLDAGMPLMSRMLGQAYDAVLAEAHTPLKLAMLEAESLPYTHVDVITVLARRWRFPETLAKPIELHHTRPADDRRDDPPGRLHRIAFVAGQVDLSDGVTRPATGSLSIAERMLALSNAEVNDGVRRSAAEYEASMALFHDVAERIAVAGDLVDYVQMRLVEASDQNVEQNIAKENMTQPTRLAIAGRSVEVMRDQDGSIVAYLYDGRGNRLLSHRFPKGGVSAEAVCESLGIDGCEPADILRLGTCIDSLAA